MSTSEKARFDTKLSKAQKAYFEQAATLGGFRTLTDFVISSAQEKANKIMEQHKRLLVSDEDKELFFNALMNPEKPNKRLAEAAGKYAKATKGK